MARFDWYQATIGGGVEPADVRSCLSSLSALERPWEVVKRPPQGYGFGDRLVDADGLLCSVFWGGTHARPHVIASGESAQVVSELLRAKLPEHFVTRADACIDYSEPGAYDRLQDLALVVARERSIKVGTAGDHLVTFRGRTLYLGAPSSHTRLRLYDKAQELRDKFTNDFHRLVTVPEHLARLECQVRPQTREAKAAASKLDPVSLMGSAAWMRELMRVVGGLDLVPFQAGKVWRQADDDRAYAAVLAQYGGLFRRMANTQGWDCLGAQIRDDLAELEEGKATARRRP